MNLYRWVVNTKQDSGPTNYIVMASDVKTARMTLLAKRLGIGWCPRHHAEIIESTDPKLYTPNFPIVI